jgi:hypothetical protein
VGVLLRINVLFNITSKKPGRVALGGGGRDILTKNKL